MATPKPCIICEDIDLYGDGLTEPPAAPEPGTLRCAGHRDQCIRCAAAVGHPSQYLCAGCAPAQSICLVCCSLQAAFQLPEPLMWSGRTGRRCEAHPLWCAACFQYSVESDEADVCSHCTALGRKAWAGPGQFDIGQLRQVGMFCGHFIQPALNCEKCYCPCKWCTRKLGYERAVRQHLPLPKEGSRVVPGLQAAMLRLSDHGTVMVPLGPAPIWQPGP